MATTSVSGPGDRLRGIYAVTDKALSYLDNEAFLAELLERTREALDADIAAALLLDRSSGELVMAAAAGLEGKAQAGVRIPVGSSFAGRVATKREPVILGDGDEPASLSPILRDMGIRSLMGVPLVATGTVIGVVQVGSAGCRRFTSEELTLLQLAADRAAAAVHSMMTRADRAAAAALQRSLLPAAPPAVSGAEMAARYVAGDGVVGGDWYDVFSLPSGELCLTIGDVAGSGLAAAVVMGRMRSALRAYALETRDPAEVLRRLDRKMQHFEPGAMATVLYAVCEPGLEQVHISAAGHLPPVVAAPGQPAVLADVPTDLMIGVDPAAPRQVTTVKVPYGTLLCFFTDGLVERPNRLLDDCLASLCREVTAGPPDEVCVAVMSALVGTTPARDDIAVLMVRRPAADQP